MIGGEQRQIAGLQPREEPPDACVKPFQRPGIARDIAAVPIKTVKLNKVGKGQGSGLRFVCKRHQMFEKCGIILALMQGANAPLRENIADFAHRMGGPPRRFCPIEQRGRGRRDGKIPAVRRADIGACRAGKGPGNDPANLHGMQHRRHGTAEVQEPLQPEALFVGSDLQDGIRRGVADRPAALLMRLPQPRDDLGARGVTIAQNACGSRRCCQCRGNIDRKTGLGVGEIVPFPRHRHPRQLPMTRRRVLAAGYFAGRPPEALRLAPKPRHLQPRGEGQRRAQTQSIEMRHMQRAAAALLGPAFGAKPGDMAQRVRAGIRAPLVEKRRRIRRAADADAVHHDQKRPAHPPILSRISAGSSGGSSAMR